MKDNFCIKVTGDKNYYSLETYLFDKGYCWRDSGFVHNKIASYTNFIIIGADKPYTMTKSLFFNNHLPFFIYPMDIKELDKFLNVVPNYEPRKLIRE
jgi:hypothetical protein